MATGYTNYARNKILDWLVRGQALVQTPGHLAMFTVAPTAIAAGTEVVYTGYSRVNISASMTATFWSGAGFAIKSNTVLRFPVCSSSTSVVVALGVMDAATAGNVLFYLDLTPTMTLSNVAPGWRPTVPSGLLTIGLT